jgi:imidazolonepropionase-like amidohydrolase
MHDLLIRNASIIDGTGQAAFDGDLLVRDGRIASVGSVGSIDEEPDIQAVDATGLTLMPGLIDAHCHITFDEPRSNDELFFHRRAGLAAIIAARNVQRLLRAGVTGFLDADCIYDLGVDVRDAIESGVIEGPRMSTGGYALLTSVGGTAGQLIPDAGTRGYAKIVSSRAEITTEVRRQVKTGVDWIKVHVTGLIPRQRDAGEIQAWSLDELRCVCDTAHELGVPVVGHCRNPTSIRNSVRAGMDMILHATFMDEPTLEEVIEAKVPLVPTFTFQANLADYGDQVGANPDLREVFRREIEDSAQTLRRAYDAGVPLLCGSESGFSLTPYGDWHYRELQVFVEALGLTPLQAISCATRECAVALGLAGQVGELTEGQLADLLLFDGDPAADVKILGERSRIKAVYIGGRAIDLEDRDPPRRPIAGWRTSAYSDAILRRRDVLD